MQKIMDRRWCESCDTECYSNFCIEENMCRQVVEGCACATMTVHTIAKAKLYNDYQLKIFERKYSVK